MTIALLAVASLLQAPAARGATPHDSAVQMIVAVGQRVSAVRSALGQFRRAAFNAQDAHVVQWGDTLRQRCQTLREEARGASRNICRGCLPQDRQSAVESYRGTLAAVVMAADHCANMLRSLRRDSIAATARGLRREVRPIGNTLVAGFRPYELRLARVRDAFGWSRRETAAPPSQPRPSGR
jgi:hypothetical protein